MMKVLWFSLSPCGSMRRNKTSRVIQGWMVSLEDEIKKNENIDLSVAYFSSEEKDPFMFEGITYYPMFEKKSSNPLIRIHNRKRSMIKRDNLVLPLMISVVNKCNPDLIHIHGTEQSFGLIQDYIKNIPIVFSIQGLIAPYKEKFYSGIPSHEAERNESLIEDIRGFSSRCEYRSFCERAIRECHYLKYAKYIMGRTQWDYDITGLLNPNRKYYLIDEIIRPQFYVKRWAKESFDEKLKIVSTISGGIYKGYETALKAAKLLKAYASFDFEWHIIGYDSKSKWVIISEKLTGLNSSFCNMVFHGRIDAEELSDILVKCDIYVHVSHIENSPNSVCEAMLLGLPVIASYSGGTVSLLENENEGVLVQDGDPYSLAGAIVRLQQDFLKSKDLGYKAHIKATERHNQIRIARNLVKAYFDIIFDYNKAY